MAQAARLNLRMQKELKLLLTDPPPGVSLPMLSSSSSSDDISLIHAQIRGPEGTVYANGVFTIKIQIPDRYPFQPPNVTFATPIYHPNIDNGGRICLDILNLPPKGAWQPSLNVSTVLTSIGLLLSEPNPDDGLMCDVSREYKYNRQIFDQRAQSMTEKYAKATINGSTSSAGSTPVNPNLSMIKTEGFNLGSGDADTENKGNQKKLTGVSRKLSLESTENNGNQKKLTGVSRKLSLESTENNGNQKKLTGVSRNLSLEPLGSSQGRNNHEESNKGGNLLVDVCGGQLPHQYHVDKHVNNCKNVSTGKPHDSKRKLVSSNSSSSTHSNVEEILVQTPYSLSDSRTLSMISSKSGAAVDGNQVNRHPYKVCEGNANNSCVNLSDKKQSGISQKLSIRSWHSPQNENVEEKESALQPASKHERQQLQPVNKKKAENSTKKTMSKVLGISKKVSVNVSDVSKTWDGDDDKENVPPNYQVIPKSLSLRMPQAGNYDRQQSHPDNCLHAGNGSSNKKFCGLCRKLSLGSSGTSKTSDVVDMGNVLPIQKSFPHSQSLHTVSSTSMSMPHNGNQPNQEVCIGKDNIQKPEDDPSINEDIIVLDSEDSEEEAKGPPMKSRLSLSRRCLAGKRKDKA